MPWMWIGFILFVLILLALDLGVFHRKAHDIKFKEAMGWSVVWISLAMVFNVFIYFAYENHWLGLGKDSAGQVVIDIVDHQQLNGHNAAVKFFTGYVIEKSLSVDNIFVIALVFAAFKIPGKYQHRVLFWGILGALIMRGIFIGLGSAVIERFHYILYVFGAFLIFTAYKMIASGNKESDPRDNILVKVAQRFFPITHELHGQALILTRASLATHPATDFDVSDSDDAGASPPTPPKDIPAGSGKYVLTPLALALVVVEATDLVFAVDSIPAIFGITADPFLVFTSNVFAILGLRSLYFALAGVLDKFHYLKISLAVILALVGVKMLFADLLKKNDFLKGNLSFITLGLIVLILAAGVFASMIWNKKHPNGEEHELVGTATKGEGE